MSKNIWVSTNSNCGNGLFDDFGRAYIECLDQTRYKSSFRESKPKVKRVIFNNPATIIFWTDNTKTVVKCQDGDEYDKERGFVMAYLKKLLGNDNTFNKEINKWVRVEQEGRK